MILYQYPDTEALYIEYYALLIFEQFVPELMMNQT
jgi:hypothetical protein